MVDVRDVARHESSRNPEGGMQQMIHRDRMRTRLASGFEGGRSQSAAISRSQLLGGA